MKTLFFNRYLDAFAKSIFLFGVFHIIVLIILAIRDGEQVLNIFAILGLHFFVSGLEDGFVNFVLSYCIALTVYFIVFSYLTNQTKENDTK